METFILGFIFGAILQYARLNRFDTIAGMAVLQNFTIAKTISFTIGLGALLLQAEIYFGWADYHIKPLLLAGVLMGGLLFGVGMAILGYCPGTVVISWARETWMRYPGSSAASAVPWCLPSRIPL